MSRRVVSGIMIMIMMTGMPVFASNIGVAEAVDTTPPTINVLHPQNETYHINQNTTHFGPLNFTVDEPTDWIGYNLDGSLNNVTIDGNTTLLSLSLGLHNIVVYANDTSSNMGASGMVYFNITFYTDLNLDGKVRIDDVYLAANAFGSEPGHPRWNPLADIDDNDVVRVNDVLIVALDFGETL